jgi:hypothetical protein
MGSRRVGLARTQALIENLKRELNLNGATLKDLNVQLGVDGLVEASTASKAIVAADTGKVIELHRAAGSTVTLPDSATIGQRFTVVVRTLLSGGAYVINAGTGNTFSTSSFIVQQDATTAGHHAILRPTDAADVTLTMTYHVSDKTAQFGTVYEVECVAAGKWRITGDHHIDASGTAVFA